MAQVEISKPRVEIVDDKMIINYEIFGRSSEDTINIALNITDNLGNKIEPKALEGDVGKNIGAGTHKKIIWDLSVDSFYVNMNLHIGIVADVIKPPEIVAAKEEDVARQIDEQIDTGIEHVPADSSEVKEEDVAQQIDEQIDTGIEHVPDDSSDIKEEQIYDVVDDKEIADTDIPTDIKSSVSVGKIAMLSTIFPGWGLTKLSHKKPYWLLGIAGAGCIAGSVYFNHQAYSNYEKYTCAENVSQMNDYYNEAEKQQKISNYLTISAVAIWIADVGVASLKAASINRKARSEKSKITMDWHFDAISESPMLSLIYKF